MRAVFLRWRAVNHPCLIAELISVPLTDDHLNLSGRRLADRLRRSYPLFPSKRRFYLHLG
jgi:hypothetical protein